MADTASRWLKPKEFNGARDCRFYGGPVSSEARTDGRITERWSRHVTGASGGVGSVAVALLAKNG
ncbi:MAG: hypothetical protein P8J55_13985 [Pseudomonadales bacterium]|nr:hypothetical protein [Pseudomonadales bacterium]